MKDLTKQECARMFTGKDSWQTWSDEEKGIPGVRMSDGPVGLRIETGGGLGFRTSKPAVVYPAEALLACSWDEDLLYRIGTALAEECRAEGVQVLLGPGVNHKRDPRCGRNFEYFSEDPLLSARLGAAYIRGLQDHGVGCSLKHYAANSREKGRMVQDSIVDERALREIYLRQFEEIIRRADPWTIMCAYNKLNGTYCTENSILMQELARREWGFNGIFISDWGAVSDPVRALHNGLNLEMPGGGHGTADALMDAEKQGVISEAELRENAAKILELADKTKTEQQPADLEAHLALAQEAAEKSAVLMKNSGLLPLKKDMKVLLAGTFAKQPRMQGAGSSRVNAVSADDLVSVFEQAGISFSYAKGYHISTDTVDPVLEEQAKRMAVSADAVIIAAGLPEGHEAEGYDRLTLDMPECQNHLIEAVSAVNANTVVLLECGAPVRMPWLDHVSAVLCMYLAGGRGSHAAYRLLYGLADPCGKLAETWPLRTEDLPAYGYFDSSMLQSEYRESIFTGYRYYDTAGQRVCFPFGWGLSYTSFEYSGLQAEVHGDAVTISVTVTNTGTRNGRETVLFRWSLPESRIMRPARELLGFAAVDLKPGESRTVQITADRERFAYWDVQEDRWMIEKGSYVIACAPCGGACVSTRIELDGTETPYSDIGRDYLEPMISRNAFEGVLRHAVPAVRPARPFTRDTTIEELKECFLGRRLNRIINRYLRRHPMADIRASMILEAPLRNMLMAGSSRITWKTVDAAAYLLNGHYFRGIPRILKSLRRKQR